MKTFIKKHAVLTYLAITFAFAWVIISILIAHTDTDMSRPDLGVILAGWVLGFAPLISSLVVTYVAEGRLRNSSIEGHLKRKSGGGLYIAAVTLVPIMTLITVLLTHFLVTPYQIKIVPPMIVLGLIWGIFSAIGEEPGWRGFLLPHLMEKNSAFQSSLIVGIIWAVWHLPINYMGYRFYGEYMPVFMLVTSINLTLDGLIIGGLYTKGKGNLKLTMLYHYTLTGMTILEGAICQMTDGSYVNCLYSNGIGFVVKGLFVLGIWHSARAAVYGMRINR